MIDLDKEREERSRARAQTVGREVTGPVPIVLNGKKVAELPPEVPFTALAPLETIDDEIALLLREALVMSQRGGGTMADATSLVVDLVVANKELPKDIVRVVKAIAAALLGEDGLRALIAEEPSVADLVALVKAVFAHYGMGLGESSRPADSSPSGGSTSDAISSGSTDSTPEESTDAPATPGS